MIQKIDMDISFFDLNKYLWHRQRAPFYMKRKQQLQGVACIIFAFLLSSVTTATTIAQLPFLKEAETASFKGPVTVCRDSSASNGSYVDVRDSGAVTCLVTVPVDGYYMVSIRYRSPKIPWGEYTPLIRNQDHIAVGIGMRADWDILSQPVRLVKGSNTVGIAKGYTAIEVDWFKVEACDPVPTVTPQHITYCRSAPRDITLKVDNYGQKITVTDLHESAVPLKIQPYPFQEQASLVTISNKTLSGLPEGLSSLNWFIGDKKVVSCVQVLKNIPPAGFMIIAPYIGHGSAVLLRCPDRKFVLIDCATGIGRDSLLIPFLEKNGIDTISTFILTHYHDDHDGEDKGEKIKRMYHVQNFIDYKTYKAGYNWKEHGLDFTILNAYDNGTDENARSLCFMVKYKGFRYLHSGDIYAANQVAIQKCQPKLVRAEVFYGNHHFHGSTDAAFVVNVNSDLIIFQSNEAIYAASTYMGLVKNKILPAINVRRKVPVEMLPSVETGMTVIRVKDKKHWWYETYKNQNVKIKE